MKPNFFIVGAPKAGTTSLHFYLSQHPDIYMSEPKEINYFTAQEIHDQVLYYNLDLIFQEEEYLKIFQSDDENVVGESSVSYLFYPNAAKRIHEFNPNSKILISLRNPVERAFSHYLMDTNLGYNKNSFENLFEDFRHGRNSQFTQQFFELGFYFEQVNRYKRLFGRNLKVILYEDLGNNLTKTCEEIFSFLNVSNHKIENYDIVNSFARPKNKFVKRIYMNPIVRKATKKIVPPGLVNKVKSSLEWDKKKPILEDSIRTKLSNLYSEDLKQLEKLINRDLSSWVS